MALVLLLSPTDVLNEFIKDMDLARDDTGWFFAIAYNPSFQLPQNRLQMWTLLLIVRRFGNRPSQSVTLAMYLAGMSYVATSQTVSSLMPTTTLQLQYTN